MSVDIEAAAEALYAAEEALQATERGSDAWIEARAARAAARDAYDAVVASRAGAVVGKIRKA